MKRVGELVSVYVIPHSHDDVEAIMASGEKPAKKACFENVKFVRAAAADQIGI